MRSLFDHLRELTLPAGTYAVFGSGPLLARGIIDHVNDLDVLCHPSTWQLVAAQAEVKYLEDYEVTIASMLDGAITFGTEWGIGHFDVADLIRTAETIDGLPFVRLEHVAAYKRLRGGAKDLDHLRRISRYLSAEENG